MLGVQYTYFAAIDTSNAATATLLQYLAPVVIALYLMIKTRKFLQSKQESVAILFALIGTFLLVTNGSVHKLSITLIALTWGILSAVALAFYTLYPKKLLEQFGSVITVGWGMLIGGFGLNLIDPVLQYDLDRLSISTLLWVAFVVLFGTLVPFYLYIDSLRYISPTETSVLANAEPLTAVIASIILLHTSFGLFEAIGGLFITGTVVLLSVQPKKATQGI